MERAGSAAARQGRGVAPSAIASLVRERSVRLGAALAVAVAIPVAVLFYFQFQSLRDLGQSSTLVLRQLSQETADGVTESLEDALKSPYINVLLRVTQTQTEPLNLPFIQNLIDQSLASDPYVTRYLVWSDVTTVHRGIVLSYGRGFADFSDGGRDGRQILRRIRELASERRPQAAFEAAIDGRPAYIQAQLRYDSPARNRLTSFIALAVEEDRFRRQYLPALVAAKLQNVSEPTGFPRLTVTVLDSEGEVVYPPGGAAPRVWVDERTFPLVFFDRDFVDFVAPAHLVPPLWRVRTGYADRTIGDIIEDRAKPQRAMMTLLAAVMAVGVFVVARAAAREVRLAELKSTFVASVSHDLKTPLALIQLFAETLELGRLKNTDRAHEYYRIINSEARKLTRLIDNLLDFSRIEAGLRHYELEPADLGEVTAQVLAALESQFRQNGFTVRVQVPPAPPRVLLDREAAKQAIDNLLSNAMKYSPDSREIAVDVDAVPGYGRVRVTDYGVGIPASQQRKVFRKFYRVASDAGSGPQGCGLGLAIVDHVMRGHHGHVEVDSEPGRGSTFTLSFPLDGESHGEQTDSGDRGRAADVARSA